MSGFSAEWLALREPADSAARSESVTAFVSASLTSRSPLRIVDVGSGTGANVRFLASRLPRPQEWLLIDADVALLASARMQMGSAFEVRPMDLRQLDAHTFEQRDLVTASALLDLVSDHWLRRFVQTCRETGAAVLVALNYDGRFTCSPVDGDDQFVRELVNRHQQIDKGFGPALGPDAGRRVAMLLSEAGYTVRREPSDWMLDARHLPMQAQLIEGWAAAASEIEPSAATRIREWQDRRLLQVASGASTIDVGHDDVGAILAGLR
jgi:SAM-dependent methyltransferase